MTYSEKSNAAYRLLPPSFYLEEDVVGLARQLLGKILVTEIDGQVCRGRIVETEAYRAPDDRACHAWNNRRTSRTEIMFAPGGHAYVYLCYGIHHLFNVVTGPPDQAHAVLVRGLEPLQNVAAMLERRGLDALRPQLTAGPGVLSQAMGIKTSLNGVFLADPNSPIRLETDGVTWSDAQIRTGTRVGVESAGRCALRPWRFSVRKNRWVSPRAGAGE
mgnify:CR=1 FL=1